MIVKNFYGWRILAAGFLILILDGGVRFSFGVLIKPLSSEFSWDRSAITFAYTLNMMIFGLCQPLAGKLLDRFGPRFLFPIAALITAAGLVLTSQIKSIFELYVYYGVITGIGVSGMSIGVISSTLSRWFMSLRGFVSGVAISGTALGQFLLIPLLALLMGRFGWRWAWFILAVLLCLMVIPISLVVMKKEPSDVGQDAYGSGTEDKRERIDPLPEDSSGSIPQAICSRNYLLTAATYFICGFQDYLFVTQLIPFVTDKGLTTQEASNLQGFAGLTSIVGLLFIAALSEKVGRKIPLFLTFLPRFVCFGLLLISSRRPFLYTSALLFGFAHMASAPLTAALIGDLYGLKNIGTLTGTIFWIHQTGGALGAYLGGIIYDLTNSYMVAFAGALFLAGVAALTSISISERGTKG